MKSLKSLSQASGMASIGIGAMLLIRGLRGDGILWAAISGAVIICSGIMNIVSIRLGVLDALGLLLIRLFGLSDKKTGDFVDRAE